MKKISITILLLILISNLDFSYNKKIRRAGKFADKFNPDKAAKDPNRHAWESCYEIQGNRCLSWGWTPIPKGCVVVYDKCNFRGTGSIVCGDMKKLVMMHKKVSSVKLGPNTGIHLFSKSGLKGKKIALVYNEPCLINHKFDRRAQSLKILVKNS